MISNIKAVLNQLNLPQTGTYDNHYYVISLEDSDDYAKCYTNLGEVAINTEYPSFGVNSTKNTTKVTNYFEYDFDNVTYLIFLIADFENDKYYVKIGEKS